MLYILGSLTNFHSCTHGKFHCILQHIIIVTFLEVQVPGYDAWVVVFHCGFHLVVSNHVPALLSEIIRIMHSFSLLNIISYLGLFSDIFIAAFTEACTLVWKVQVNFCVASVSCSNRRDLVIYYGMKLRNL